MKSELTLDFLEMYWKLPRDVRDLARESYKRWLQDPTHPGIDFKKLEGYDAEYSARVGIHYRAVAVLDDDTYLWYWIGTRELFGKTFR